jgi:hypothetical protein
MSKRKGTSGRIVKLNPNNKKTSRKRPAQDDDDDLQQLFQEDDELMQLMMGDTATTATAQDDNGIDDIKELHTLKRQMQDTAQVREEIELDKAMLDGILNREENRQQTLNERHKKQIEDKRAAEFAYYPQLGYSPPMFFRPKMENFAFVLPCAERFDQADAFLQTLIDNVDDEEKLLLHLSSLSDQQFEAYVEKGGSVQLLQFLFKLSELSLSLIVGTDLAFLCVVVSSTSLLVVHEAFQLFRDLVTGNRKGLENLLSIISFQTETAVSNKVGTEWMPNSSDFLRALQFHGLRDVSASTEDWKQNSNQDNIGEEVVWSHMRSEVNIEHILKLIEFCYGLW